MTFKEARNHYLTKSGKFRTSKFLKDDSEYLNFLKSIFVFSSIEKLAYRVKNKLFETPKCPTCGKDLEYSKSKQRFKFHCNSSCASLDNNVKNKCKETCLVKYGKENYNNHKNRNIQC